MNASPAQPVSPTASPQRSQASGRGGNDAFAGLFARLNPGAEAAQAEPTALPASPSIGADTAATDPQEAGAGGEVSPDAQLLAALGLAPLPTPPPVAWGPGLLGYAASSEGSSDDAATDALRAGTRASTPSALANLLSAQQAAPAALTATGSASSGHASSVVVSSVSAQTAALSAAALAAGEEAAPDGPRHAGTSSVLAQLVRAGGLAAESATAAADTKPSLAGIAIAADNAADELAAQMPVALPAATAKTAAATAADFRPLAGQAPAAVAITAAKLPAEDALAIATGAGKAEPDAVSARSTLIQSSAALVAERADFAQGLRDSLSPMTPTALPVATRLDPTTPQFSGQLSQQIAWLADQKIGRAEIRLHPEELGPLEVGIELEGDEIRAEFSSRSVEVRSLIESQVPKLRELLAEQGFSLADAQIGQERAAYSDAETQRQNFKREGSASDAGGSADGIGGGPTITSRARQGLIDDYA